MDTVIAIIGTGNMGRSLLGGLLSHGYPEKNIWITDPSQEKLDTIVEKFNVHCSTDNGTAVKQAHIVIFAVKPAIVPTIAAELREIIQQRHMLVISVAAGVRIASIQTELGQKIPIVRAMPNTPALIGCGATALFANDQVSDSQKNLAESILRALGIALWLDNEKLLDAVTALSGCGPAYFFLTMEALQEAGEKLGLPADLCRMLTLQTAYGSAKMALESEKDVTELRHQVTSPGGSTERAIQVFEEAHIREIFMKALFAAYQRAEEIADRIAIAKGNGVKT